MPISKWIILLIFLPLLLAAQESDPGRLTLARIFSSDEFNARKIGRTQWFDNGSRYTRLESPEGGSAGEDIVSYDSRSGRREVLVPAAQLTPPGADRPLEIAGYTFSPDRTQLLIFTNTRRVWRQNTRGDYWVLHRPSGRLHQLGGGGEPATLMFAEFSPDLKKVGYVRHHDIYVEDLANHEITRLTDNGSATIINGTFDWVYEEELSLRKGFRWSPDSRSIAYWQLDAAGVGVFNMINNTDSIYSEVIPVQYPKVGTTNSAGRVGVIDAAGGETRWLDIPGDPRNNYIARMDWADNSDEVIIQHLNRLQNTNRVLLGNAASGEVKTIFTDRDSAWVEVVNDLYWLNGGKWFTWISERDGWKHVYKISRDGKTVQLLTPGDYDVISIEGIDINNGWLYFIASPENPTQRYLYRARLDGRNGLQRLTPAEFAGTSDYDISPDCRWAFHTYSNFDSPPVTQFISLPEHRSVRMLEDNAALKSKLATLKRRPVEFFRVEIEPGVQLDGYQIKPYDFDPGKQYPVLFHVYGEPASSTVRDNWGGSRYLWHTFLAQQGYLIISIDNRGTKTPRGRDWRKSIYRQIGILASADQAAAARQIRRWDYVDATRIAIWGWSGGGSMSLNAIFRYPELYQTAMAIAFISDQHIYDTIYQERYMGLPADNVAGFRDGSPITFAGQLQGNLLIIHGTGDDNCHYQSAEMLMNELILHNKLFTAVPYPNRTHAIREGENTTRHLYETLTWYLNRHTPPGHKGARDK